MQVENEKCFITRWLKRYRDTFCIREGIREERAFGKRAFGKREHSGREHSGRESIREESIREESAFGKAKRTDGYNRRLYFIYLFYRGPPPFKINCATFYSDLRSTWEWAHWIPPVKRNLNPNPDPHTHHILQGCGSRIMWQVSRVPGATRLGSCPYSFSSNR
jgi:hypothetical protein